MRSPLRFALLGLVAACAHVPSQPVQAPVPRPSPQVIVAEPARIDVPCADCSSIPMSPEVKRAVEARIADLKARGGDCQVYGRVLEASYRGGLITIRPYMWRVGNRLAAGEAKSTGEMTLAREIDSLNVGVRGIDELTWSMEHEAVHIAFGIAPGPGEHATEVDAYVHACRS
jgi:hypothetical protein